MEAALHPDGCRDMVMGELGLAYARAGRREQAEKLAFNSGAADPFIQARIFTGLGTRDRTFEALDRGTAAGPFRMGRAIAFPEFAFLKGDPRLNALRHKVGLPE